MARVTSVSLVLAGSVPTEYTLDNQSPAPVQVEGLLVGGTDTQDALSGGFYFNVAADVTYPAPLDTIAVNFRRDIVSNPSLSNPANRISFTGYLDSESPHGLTTYTLADILINQGGTTPPGDYSVILRGTVVDTLGGDPAAVGMSADLQILLHVLGLMPAAEAPVLTAARCCAGVASLTWQPYAAAGYTGILIYKDGALYDAVAVSETDYTDPFADFERSHTYYLVAVGSGQEDSAPSNLLTMAPCPGWREVCVGTDYCPVMLTWGAYVP